MILMSAGLARSAPVFALARAPLPWARVAVVLLLSVSLHAWLISVARHGFDDVDEPRTEPRAVQATLMRAPPPAVATPAPAPRPLVRRPRPAPPSPEPVAGAAAAVPVPLPSLAELDASAFGVVEPAPEPPPPTAAATPPDAVPPPDASAGAPEPVPPATTALADLALEMAENGLRAGGLPARAEYVYTTRVSDITLVSATTRLTWALDGAAYEARLTSSAMGITLAELTSSGQLVRYGLAPRRYTQKSGRRATTAANFDTAARRVTFSARSHERPWREGMQDRLSFQFQLMALAQHLPARFERGAVVVFPVASSDDVEDYRFVVVGEEPVRVGEQEIATIKLDRPRQAGGAGTRIEVWLAPSLNWLPVRLRFTERNNRVWENTLERVDAAS
jgi:hypothetical protein